MEESREKNIPILEAAERLGKTQQFVRIALQRGLVSFGFAVKGSGRYSYHISPKLFNEYVGDKRSANNEEAV